MQYAILQQAKLDALENEVREFLLKGWTPLGGVAMSFSAHDQSAWKPSEPVHYEYAYVQAMTKPDEIKAAKADPEAQIKTKSFRPQKEENERPDTRHARAKRTHKKA